MDLGISGFDSMQNASDAHGEKCKRARLDTDSAINTRPCRAKIHPKLPTALRNIFFKGAQFTCRGRTVRQIHHKPAIFEIGSRTGPQVCFSPAIVQVVLFKEVAVINWSSVKIK